MKTILLFAALVCVSASNKIFANEVKISPVVMQTFKASFGQASDVQWTVVEHLYRATFILDDEQTIAFFSFEDGSLLATCHYRTLSELPRTLQRSLKVAVGSNVIKEIFEVQNDNGPDYFATVQQETNIVILKAANTKWNVYKKE